MWNEPLHSRAIKHMPCHRLYRLKTKSVAFKCTIKHVGAFYSSEEAMKKKKKIINMPHAYRLYLGRADQFKYLENSVDRDFLLTGQTQQPAVYEKLLAVHQLKPNGK